MSTKRLLFPEDMRWMLAGRYARQRADWLISNGSWPLVISLGCPNEEVAVRHPDAVRAWVAAWQAWQGTGNLEWLDRRWRTLGLQRLPRRLMLTNATEVAEWIGQTNSWQTACIRYKRLVARWPGIVCIMRSHFDVLTEYDEEDFHRLESLMEWLEVNPRSFLYPRQLPVPGIDSKWIESRKTLLANLFGAVHAAQEDNTHDFYQTCGLRPIPDLIRIRLLDSRLRKHIGNLSDVTAPIADVAQLRLPIERVYIVENIQTGLAFEDTPDAAVIMGLGYHVDVLGQIPWLFDTKSLYWGDLDTHGFAILNRARVHIPKLRSMLMNEATLLRYKELWVEEKRQHSAPDLPLLNDDERNVYTGLREQRWGLSVRLEQERIPWSDALEVINSHI